MTASENAPLVEALRALHRAETDHSWAKPRCAECNVVWPCDTELILRSADD